MAERSTGATISTLTPTGHQLEVLRARCQTGPRKEATALLGISPETVRWHLARLFRRCGCVDEAHAGWRHREEMEGRGSTAIP